MEKNKLMENLFLTGCVVKDHIRVWSGTKRLKPMDLGMDPSEVNNDLFTLGSKYLIPKEEINKLYKIRAKAKQAITDHGFSFDFGTNFIPNGKLESLKASLDACKVEFETTLNDIGDRYPAMRQKLLDAWQAEAVGIAARRGNPELVLEVMDRIRSCFKSWDEVKNGFDFSYREYRDINEIAKEFIGDVTRGIVEKLAEMASKIKTRIEESNLSERNLTPIREYLDSIKSGLMVFNNDKIDSMINEMYTWSLEGSANETMNELKSAAMGAMDKLIDAAENQMDEIVKESVESMTNYKRKIQM